MMTHIIWAFKHLYGIQMCAPNPLYTGFIPWNIQMNENVICADFPLTIFCTTASVCMFGYDVWKHTSIGMIMLRVTCVWVFVWAYFHCDVNLQEAFMHLPSCRNAEIFVNGKNGRYRKFAVIHRFAIPFVCDPHFESRPCTPPSSQNAYIDIWIVLSVNSIFHGETASL